MLRQLRDPEYFNPRSHEGSDGIFADLYAKKVISIHAPTRGATRYCFCIKLVIGFQSTLPRGERQLFEVANAAVKSISIHAPTRGATFANAIKLDKLLFQSTLPRGERHSVCINFFCALKISIHAPTRGATRCSYKLTNMSLISIHAPTRGATMTSTGYVRRMCNFNPRSHEGSDPWSDQPQ